MEERDPNKPPHLMATGSSFSDESAESFLATHFALRFTGESVSTTASYIQVDPEHGFNSFAKRPWIAIDGALNVMEATGSVVPSLPLISAGRYGPPERVGANRPTGTFGCFAARGGGHQSRFAPWFPGALYYRHGFADHQKVIMDLLRTLELGNAGISTDAPPSVELSYDRIGDDGHDSPDGHILQLLNLSGFNGMTFHPPLDIHDVEVRIEDPDGGIGDPQTLGGTPITWDRVGTELQITIPNLKEYLAIFLPKGASDDSRIQPTTSRH